MSARLLPVLAMATLVVMALAIGPRVEAQTPPPPVQVRVSLDRTSALLGERVHLTVIALHPADVLVSVDVQSLRPELRVIDTLPEVRQPATGNNVTTRFEYVLAGFSLGQAQLDVFGVSWLRADGSTGAVPADTPVFEVRPTLASADADLRPLKPQLGVEGAPPAWQRPALTALAVLAVLGALALVLHWVRARLPRRHTATAEPTVTTPATIEGISRRRLDELAAADRLAGGDYDRYYGDLASVVREYLATRFEFSATALTTTELEQRMTRQGVERWQARLVGGLLERCDAAVYAGRRPDPASADHDLTVAYEIIELANPAAEAEQPAVEVAG